MPIPPPPSPPPPPPILWVAPATPLILPPPVLPVEEDAAALAADAARYAALHDVSPVEAMRRLQLQEASVATSLRLADHYRDRLAGLFVAHVPDYRLVVVLAGDAPVTDAAEATLGAPLPVEFRTGAPATRAQLLEAIRLHQADLRAALPHPPGMGVDARTGMLAVMVRAQDLDLDGQDATAARLSAIAGVPVRVATWEGDGHDLAVEGGGRVAGDDPAAGRRFVCTSGFVVTDGARTAITTAAHCPDQLRYLDRDGHATPLDLVGAWGARYQDVQIHLAGVPLQPAFLADDPDRPRLLTGWRNRAATRAGDFVCHRGERTGYSCADVAYVDYAPPGDLCAGPCEASWVAVAGPTCKGGDSGGPVFLGTVAFGLLKGDSSADGTCRLYYYQSTDYLPPGWTLLHR